MKIGILVQRNISAIFEYCETRDQSEFARLQDPHYSKETLDINYPFCRPAAKIGHKEHARYWKHDYIVHGGPVRVTSQWFNPPTSNSLKLFRKFLTERGIDFDDSADMPPERPNNAPLVSTLKARGRYKLHAIGNGQNSVARYILGQLGDEQFSAAHWEAVIADFGNRCAYCGTEGELVMDHVVPINKQKLGEHRLGNLVPACRSYNAQKGPKDFRDFLTNDPARIAAIAAHMVKHGYVPIGDHEKIRKIIDTAHQEVRQLADRYVTRCFKRRGATLEVSAASTIQSSSYAILVSCANGGIPIPRLQPVDMYGLSGHFL